MSISFQKNLKYIFAYDHLLHSALKSAHRNRDDDVLDDGNRGLAHYGTLAIQMAMTYEAIIEKGRTLRDLNTQDHWSKTKKGRAKACRLLGIEPLIEQSVRQHHQALSDTVLDFALSAVLGAIWIDCESQGQTSAAIRSTMLGILRNIDTLMLEDSSLARCETNIVQPKGQNYDPNTQNSEIEKVVFEEANDMERFTDSWFEQDLGDFLDGQYHNECFAAVRTSPPRQVESTGSLEDQLMLEMRNTASVSSNQLHVACASSIRELHAEEPQVASGRDRLHQVGQGEIYFPALHSAHDKAPPRRTFKRKRLQNKEEKFGAFYREMLHIERCKLMSIPEVERERLLRFLEHPMLEKLETKVPILPHFLYLAIGSWDTIHDFKRLVQAARKGPSSSRQPEHLLSKPAATYGVICRLEEEGALNILLRRYYTILLCEEEELYDDLHSRIIVETPSTVSVARAAKPGNPLSALDSDLTDRLLCKIMPDAAPESKEFQKARPKIKRLRKLAGFLRVLVKQYGFGILGLMPSGPSFDQMPLTDNVLLSMTQASFNNFARLLHQEQGPHLEILSRLIGPSLLELVEDSWVRDTECRAQQDVILHLSEGNVPKGLITHVLLPCVLNQ